MKSLEAIIDEEVTLAVDRIVRASRAAALTAFDQHFDRLGRQPPRQQEEAPPSVATGRRNTKGRRRSNRSAEEIAALEVQLLTAVRNKPGQPMAVLAPMLGAKSAELRVPVVRLKAKKQIKVVGRGQFAYYFPVDGDVAA